MSEILTCVFTSAFWFFAYKYALSKATEGAGNSRLWMFALLGCVFLIGVVWIVSWTGG